MRTVPGITMHTVGSMVVTLLLVMQGGCTMYLPDQQSARLVGEQEWEVTPSFSSVSFSIEGETEHVENHFRVHAAYGVSDELEVRGAYTRVSPDDGVEGVNVLGAGPKLSLGESAALFLPVGFVFGEDIEVSDTWTVAPTLLLSLPASPAVEFTPSVKAIYPFTVEDPELFVGVNLGVGITLEGVPIVLRPEAGLVVNPGDEGVAWGWTVGASLRP